MFKIKQIRNLLAASTLVMLPALANATIIHTSATLLPPGTSAYLAGGSTSHKGGWPTPYDNLSTTTAQFSFDQYDDIRVGTRIDQSALDKASDDYEVNKPNEDFWASWGSDYWQAEQLLWRTMFYHLDVNSEWQFVTGWNATVDWTSVESWQEKPRNGCHYILDGIYVPVLRE